MFSAGKKNGIANEAMFCANWESSPHLWTLLRYSSAILKCIFNLKVMSHGNLEYTYRKLWSILPVVTEMSVRLMPNICLW